MDNRLTLRENTILGDSYRIVRVIGAGGFGITYEAEDINLGSRFALKEYYPADFGDRDPTMRVLPKSERHQITFDWGKTSFLQEARMLARFRHPSIVRVSRVFEVYSTAYMVMEFEQGKNLERWLADLGRAPTQEELDRIAGPLLDALELMHAENFLHRDIAPDNIVIRPDGSPVLLDFGAARRAVGEMSRSLTGIVKAGYSPQEQYATDGRLQGAWTDLYALGATLYRAVAGRPPEEATLRMADDRLMPASERAKNRYRPNFLRAIDLCLRPKHSERPRSVAELRSILLGQGLSLERPSAPKTAAPRIGANRFSLTRAQLLFAAGAAVALFAGAYGGYEYTRRSGAAWQGAAVENARPRAVATTASDADEAARKADDTRAAQERAGESIEARQRAEATNASTDKVLQATIAEQAWQTGDRFHFGRSGAPRDYAKAREAYEQAAAEGHPRAMNGLGLLYENGLGVGKDYDKARDWFEKAVNAGNAAAMNNMGRLYREGWGVPQDYAKAREWYERALTAGHSDALISLGWMYENGWGVTRDYNKARDFYERAMARGNTFGMNNLGVFYRDGRSVTQDYPKARELFERAAALGNDFAMRNLGNMYEHGSGVPQDYSKAREWYGKAADTKQRNALFELAGLLDRGKGGPHDFQRAAKLLLEAAKRKHNGAIADLRSIDMAGWNSQTRTEIKRELQSKGFYDGPLDDKWNFDVRAAINKYLAT